MYIVHVLFILLSVILSGMNKKPLMRKNWFKVSFALILLTSVVVPAYAILNPSSDEADPLDVGDEVEILSGYHKGQINTISEVRHDSSGLTYYTLEGNFEYDEGTYKAPDVKRADPLDQFAGIRDLLTLVASVFDILTG